MFDLFFVFSALFLRTECRGEAFYQAALRMQQITADKVNIMECDPESTSVTIIFLPKSNSVHYYALIKLSTKVFKKIS